MSSLKDKIQNAIDESRILVLGAQVLLGFQFRSIFETLFAQLPRSWQYLKLSSLGLLLITLALLFTSAAYHRIVERGKDSREFHEFITRIMEYALVPFALGFGIDIFVATASLLGTTLATISAIITASVAIFCWYGLELFIKRGNNSTHQGADMKNNRETDDQKDQKDQKNQKNNSQCELKDRIKQVLAEARMVLPGAQALLGFQFAIILTESFEKLPPVFKYLHLGSLATITLTIIILMTPAAYHRIVEHGEDSEQFHYFASCMVLAAMITLALGIAGDLMLVLYKVTNSVSLSLIVSLLVLAFFYSLWFGYTLYRRSSKTAPSGHSSSTAQAQTELQ